MGDVLAFIVFVVVGRISHGFTSDWLANVGRIVTPFLIGWFVAGVPLGIYRSSLLRRPTALLVRSAAAWLLGGLIAFVLRAFLFRNNVTLPFALVSLAFTALLVLGWRFLYTWWANR